MALSGSFCLSPCLSLALYGSLWLPLWLPLALTATLWLTLALSGPLLPFNFAYIVLDRLSGPLLGSQRRCHADSLCSGLAIDDYEGNLLGGLIYIFVFFVICSKKRNIDFRRNQDQHLWKCSNYRKHCLGNPKVRQFCHYLQDHYFNPKHNLMFFILGAWRVLANWFTLQWSLEMLYRLVISSYCGW